MVSHLVVSLVPFVFQHPATKHATEVLYVGVSDMLVEDGFHYERFCTLRTLPHLALVLGLMVAVVMDENSAPGGPHLRAFRAVLMGADKLVSLFVFWSQAGDFSCHQVGLLLRQAILAKVVFPMRHNGAVV